MDSLIDFLRETSTARKLYIGATAAFTTAGLAGGGIVSGAYVLGCCLFFAALWEVV